MKKNYSLPYTRPSFVEGIARIFDFGNTLSEHDIVQRTPAQVDFLALRADWRAVARDFGIAFEEEVREAERKEQDTRE